MNQRAFIGGLPLDNVSLESIPTVLVGLALEKRKKPFLVTYLNAYHFNLAQKDEKYRRVLQEADLVYADGWGPVLAARFLGYRLPGRLTAYDFFFNFCRLCEKEGLSLFLLGGERGVACETVQELKARFSHLEIEGSYHGFFDRTEEKRLIRRINRLRPDFLLVNLGAPRQELWLNRNLPRLKVKVGWAVGGLFNYIGGMMPRAPYWLGKLGFEWLFRLVAEPKRLWQRYLFGLPVFVYTVVKLKRVVQKKRR
jgi:N-acetylglucosaminyldiphosphoundecaprenol N-acetyl-beta-D-mannosaminyltransferase